MRTKCSQGCVVYVPEFARKKRRLENLFLVNGVNNNGKQTNNEDNDYDVSV